MSQPELQPAAAPSLGGRGVASYRESAAAVAAPAAALSLSLALALAPLAHVRSSSPSEAHVFER